MSAAVNSQLTHWCVAFMSDSWWINIRVSKKDLLACWSAV